MNRLGNMMIQHITEDRLVERHVLTDISNAAKNLPLKTNQSLQNLSTWNATAVKSVNPCLPSMHWKFGRLMVEVSPQGRLISNQRRGQTWHKDDGLTLEVGCDQSERRLTLL